ncbi:MAG: SDR family oxidoreductase [Pseudomonadota bacterium]|jgi:NAD(P)-dependent dehydrogenase (short-subunit alcohol dehydrogenase family)
MSFLNLAQKMIVVAGGSGGIGQEIVRILAANNARVIIADLNLAEAKRVANEISASTVSPALEAPIPYECDISSDMSVDSLYHNIARDFGSIYGVVNSVGVVGSGTAVDCSLKEYQRQIEINCYGAMRLARGFIQHVRSQREPINNSTGRVNASYVYISSIAADLAIPERDPYCVSKAAGQAFHLNLANEVARYGINVNIVLPGRTDTPSAAERAKLSPTAALQMFATQRRRAMIPPVTIAKTCAFLLCPDLVGYSGQKITIAEGADTTYRPSYEALERRQNSE